MEKNRNLLEGGNAGYPSNKPEINHSSRKNGMMDTGWKRMETS
jgi:hypothetical protein